jgi:hypothetical protein
VCVCIYEYVSKIKPSELTYIHLYIHLHVYLHIQIGTNIFAGGIMGTVTGSLSYIWTLAPNTKVQMHINVCFNVCVHI